MFRLSFIMKSFYLRQLSPPANKPLFLSKKKSSADFIAKILDLSGGGSPPIIRIPTDWLTACIILLFDPIFPLSFSLSLTHTHLYHMHAKTKKKLKKCNTRASFVFLLESLAWPLAQKKECSFVFFPSLSISSFHPGKISFCMHARRKWMSVNEA